MRFIAAFFGLLWRFSGGGALGGDVGARVGSGSAVLYTFLWLLFLVIAIVLVVLGFDLQAIDRWIDAHTSWFQLIGDILFRAFCGFVILLCGLTIYSLGLDSFVSRAKDSPGTPKRKRDEEEDGARPGVVGGCLGIVAALAIGYLAWVGMTMSG